MCCSAICIGFLFIVSLIVTLHIVYFARRTKSDEGNKATKALPTIGIQSLGSRWCHLFPSFLVEFCFLML